MSDQLMRNHYRDAFPRADVVRVKGGYLGQILVADQIVWESTPFETAEDAGNDAYGHITDKLKELFQ